MAGGPTVPADTEHAVFRSRSWKQRALEAEDDVRVLLLHIHLAPFMGNGWVRTMQARRAQQEAARAAARRPVQLWPVPRPADGAPVEPIRLHPRRPR